MMKKPHFIMLLAATLCLAGTNSFAALLNVSSPTTAITINEGDTVNFTATLTATIGLDDISIRAV